MMPQLLTVKVNRPNARPIRVWVPLVPVLLILSPLLLLAAGAATIACLIYRISVLRALGTGWRIFAALRGTQFGLEHGHTAVLVNLK